MLGIVGGFGLIYEKPHVGRVRIVRSVRQPHGLMLMSVGHISFRRAERMGQVAVVEGGPKMLFQRLQPLSVTSLFHDAPASLQATLQQARQGNF